MIVGWVPGGTIESKLIYLKPDETLPNAFNTVHTEVWRQDPENGYRPTILVKGVGYRLPSNSSQLSNPELTLEAAIAETLPLTEPEKCDTVYEHIDIIQVGEGESDD